MNSLSWFLWLAEVADKVYGIAQVWGIIFSLGLLAMIGVATITSFVLASNEWEAKDRKPIERSRSLAFKLAFTFGFFGIVCGTIYSLIPSQRTLYTILASEVTEKLSNTKIATELGADAQEVLRGYLKKLKDGLKEEKK